MAISEGHEPEIPRQGRTRIGWIVEGIALICLLVALLDFGVGAAAGVFFRPDVLYRSALTPWSNGGLGLFVAGFSWELVVGGLLLRFWPRTMRATWLAELAGNYKAPPRRVALLMAWTGASFGILVLAAYLWPDLAPALLDGRIPPPWMIAGLIALYGPMFLLAVPARKSPRRGNQGGGR